jgi:hypothetical protein
LRLFPGSQRCSGWITGNPELTLNQQQPTPTPILASFPVFAENYPPPAHNRNSEPTSNIAHAIIHRTPRPAQLRVAQSKSSGLAFLARILSSQVRNAMQTTRFFRVTINHKPFCKKDFRVIAFTRVSLHRFPNLPGFHLHRFPNFPRFASVIFLTSYSLLYRSLRNPSI